MDDHVTDVMSSVEDLLSMDPSLRETEYYKDLGFLSIAETTSGQQMASRVTASFRLSDEANVSFADGAVIITCSTPLCCPANFGQDICDTKNQQNSLLRPPQDPHRPCTGFHGAEKEDEPGAEGHGAFPILMRSTSTSRRYSWQSPVSPGDSSRRLSFDAAEIDDLDYDSMSPSQSLNLPVGGLGAWTQSMTAHSREDNSAKEDQESTDVSCSRDDKEYDSGKRLRSKSVPATLDKISTQSISRSLGSSCPVAEGIEQLPLEKIETDHVEPNHVLIVQQVLQELKEYHGAKQQSRAHEDDGKSRQDLTWFEFLSNEKVESGKNDKPEKGTKVKRRLSSLKSRVTGSWQKDKGKSKELQKEKEKENEPKERMKYVYGHQLVPGTFSSYTSCTLCSKPLVNKNGLQCLSEYHWLAQLLRMLTAITLTAQLVMSHCFALHPPSDTM